MRSQRIKDREDWNLMDSPVTAGLMLIIMMVVFGVLLVGCASPVEGKVIEKDYDPGHNEEYKTTERKACGVENYRETTGTGTQQKTVTKTRQKWCNNRVTKTRWVPADWDLTIRTDDGRDVEVEVSQAVFDRTAIGDRVNSESFKDRISPVR